MSLIESGKFNADKVRRMNRGEYQPPPQSVQPSTQQSLPDFQKSEYQQSPQMYEIKTIPLCPAKLLQSYQADEISEINIAGKFTVKTKEGSFCTTILPYLQSDHLFDQLMGKAEHFFRLL